MANRRVSGRPVTPIQFQRHLAGDRDVTDANRAAHRELAAAGLMVAKHGEPVALGQRLDHPLDRFRLLNGLVPTDAIKPGDRVKVVAD